MLSSFRDFRTYHKFHNKSNSYYWNGIYWIIIDKCDSFMRFMRKTFPFRNQPHEKHVNLWICWYNNLYNFSLLFLPCRTSVTRHSIFATLVCWRKRLWWLMGKVCTWDVLCRFQRFWRINKSPGSITLRIRDGKFYCKKF